MQSIKEELVHLIKQNFTFKPKVLELGASSGELLYLLSDYSEKLIGIELNESFCEWGNNHLSPKIKMISDNINDVDFTDKFDLIISNYTLDHLTNPLETMKKLESVMSENGIMYLLVPNRDEALNYYSSPNTKGCYQTFFLAQGSYVLFHTRDF